MKNVHKTTIIRVTETSETTQDDFIAIESPLEIRLGYGNATQRIRKTIGITMRTIGADAELALGYLFTEGIIASPQSVIGVKTIAENIVLVELKEGILPEITRLERQSFTNSACGACGKATFEDVVTHSCFIQQKNYPKVAKHIFFHLPEKLRLSQAAFSSTGGIHAAALFDTKGNLLQLFEDVGRHNALDKLIGWAFQREMLPLKEYILLLSGRISFELVQKAWMSGISIVAAVGAPSSLAIELADDCGLTLVGFLKSNRFNIYTNESRVMNYEL
jgi:FdhD protein